MVSRIKRIVTRSEVPATDSPESGRGRIDPETLLPQVRAGISALEVAQSDLNRREQELLADASVLYEQLTLIARALVDVRQQQAVATGQLDAFRDALNVLEGRRSETHATDYSEPARADALVVQP
jgi:hypothetical protein